MRSALHRNTVRESASPAPVQPTLRRERRHHMLAGWLAELALTKIYDDLLNHQGNIPFISRVPSKMGIDAGDARTVRLAFEPRLATYPTECDRVLNQEEQTRLFEHLSAELLEFGPLAALRTTHS